MSLVIFFIAFLDATVAQAQPREFFVTEFSAVVDLEV
jgi:hypothetical protein